MINESDAVLTPKKTALKEATKEVGRYLISIGVVDSLIVVFKLLQTMINTETGGVAINWALIGSVTLFGAVSAVVRGLDKFKHTHQKLSSPEVGRSQGLIPF